MPPRLLPESSLSQVVFVHDYVQLVFQDEAFSLYNRVIVKTKDAEYEQGGAGFADSLVSLIGRAVLEVDSSDRFAIALRFDCGTQVQVLRNGSAKGLEAFQFNGPNGVIVVEQNQ
jgi:hypothetical protein